MKKLFIIIIPLMPLLISAQQQSGDIFRAVDSSSFTWTSPLLLPISTATQNALNTKQATITNGSITNAQLQNKTIVLGSTSMALGDTYSTIAGMSSITSTSFVGNLTGTASAVPWGGITGTLSNQSDLVTALGLKQNTIPTGTTLQYLKGDLSLGTFPTTTAPFASSTNKNFVTDAQLTVIQNTVGSNNGDNAVNSTYANDYRAGNFIAGTNYQVPISGGDVTTSGATATIGASKVTNTMLAGSIDLATKITGILPFASNAGTSAATSATTGTVSVSMVTTIITCTPSGNMTLNATGGVTGQRSTFVFTTSGVSSFTITFGTNFKTTSTLATGTTTAKTFCISFLYNGGTWLETGRTAAM